MAIHVKQIVQSPTGQKKIMELEFLSTESFQHTSDLNPQNPERITQQNSLTSLRLKNEISVRKFSSSLTILG